jgi:hypothetical protein
MGKELLTFKIVKIFFLVVGFLLFSGLSLKSTNFQTFIQGNKVVVAMKPIYSQEDSFQEKDYLNYQNHQQLYVSSKNISSAPKPQKIADSDPVLIIPNFPSSKNFIRRSYMSASNQYLDHITKVSSLSGNAFQGKIPERGEKHLKPIHNHHFQNTQFYSYKKIASSIQ